MTSDRVYRHALPYQRVVAEPKAGRGTQRHEKAVDALLALTARGAIVPASSRAAAPHVAAAAGRGQRAGRCLRRGWDSNPRSFRLRTFQVRALGQLGDLS